MYSDNECQKKMISKKVQDWLFLLASLQDDITRYYACLAICMLVSNKEIEKDVIKSGTLALVEPFLTLHSPEDFAQSDYRHSQGRPREWLAKLVPMLKATRREARSLAAYHFAMEAAIKKEQENMKIFQEIKAVDALKEVASSPDEVPAKFARMALKIIGEEVPYKLSHQVPLWSVEDVTYWVTKIGFKDYAKEFERQMVDGDLLLLLTDEELERDIGMKSGLLRKRFQRELDSLKVAADYGCVDETQMDRMLMSINPELSIYTYRLLELGFDTNTLSMVTDDMLKDLVCIQNPVHRSKILHISQEFSHIEDMEMEILRKHIEVFISYRRSSGSQLASLIKVLLQLRGRKVFIDVDRLYAGKFDSSLLKNIQAANHFILVLSPGAMDRCLEDEECEDWVHKEIRCALEHNRNIIPIFDPGFEWPEESRIPPDIRAITRFNGVRWVHEYQEACVDKLEQFLSGEVSTDHVAPSAVQLAIQAPKPRGTIPNRGGQWTPQPLPRPPSPPPGPNSRRPKPSLPVQVTESPEQVSKRSQSQGDDPVKVEKKETSQIQNSNKS
jgi:hypothetical protein